MLRHTWLYRMAYSKNKIKEKVELLFIFQMLTVECL